MNVVFGTKNVILLHGKKTRKQWYFMLTGLNLDHHPTWGIHWCRESNFHTVSWVTFLIAHTKPKSLIYSKVFTWEKQLNFQLHWSLDKGKGEMGLQNLTQATNSQKASWSNIKIPHSLIYVVSSLLINVVISYPNGVLIDGWDWINLRFEIVYAQFLTIEGQVCGMVRCHKFKGKVERSTKWDGLKRIVVESIIEF